MRRGAFILACWLALTLRLTALDFREFKDAAQDGTGLIWTIADAEISGEKIWSSVFSTDGSAWRLVGCPDAKGQPRATRLLSTKDGRVLCLWGSDAEPPGFFVTEHRGTETRRLGTLSHESKKEDWDGEPEWLEGRDGELWFLKGNQLSRMARDGTSELVRRLAETELTRPFSKPKSAQEKSRDSTPDDGSCAIHLLADGHGQLWLWGLARNATTRALRYPLLFDGKEWRSLKRIAGLPDTVPALVAVKDADHLWCLFANGKLFEIEVTTLHAAQIPAPKLGATETIIELRAAGSDGFVITESEEVRRPGQPRRPQGGGEVWRWRQRTWAKLIAGIDDDGSMGDRPWLHTPRGEFVGRTGSGVFWLPPNSDHPALLDWRQGIGLAKISRTFELPGDRLLLLDFTGASVSRFQQIVKLPIELRPELPYIEAIRPWVKMVQADDASLWYVAADRRNQLRGHEGAGWKDHAFPDGLAPARVGRLATDSQNRVWLLPDDKGKATAIFDPKSASWQTYPSLEAAAVAQLPNRAELKLAADWQSPIFSADGRILFSHPSNCVHYFDGKRWRVWDRVVVYAPPLDHMLPEIHPFFSRAGRPSWNYESIDGKVTVEGADDGGSRKVGFENNPADLSRGGHSRPDLPRGCSVTDADSIVADRLGGVWLTARRELYRAAPGVSVRVFAEGQVNPFVDARRLDRVIIAKDGDIYLGTDELGRGEIFHLRFPSPAPKCAVQAEAVSADTMGLAFSSAEGEGKWFRWRLDGGAWSDPTTEASVTLEALPTGEHRVEAVALDRWLRADPAPASALFTISAGGDQIARLIRQLAHPDFDQREAAIRILARHPDLARPALRAARESAPVADRWWIAAALTEVESQTPNGRKNTEGK